MGHAIRDERSIERQSAARFRRRKIKTRDRGQSARRMTLSLRCRRQECRDRSWQRQQPAWASSRDAIPEGSGRPVAASAPCWLISSPWHCRAGSSGAAWPAVGDGTARRSGRSAPGRRPARALRSPIAVPAANPASWRSSALQWRYIEIVALARATSRASRTSSRWLTVVVISRWLRGNYPRSLAENASLYCGQCVDSPPSRVTSCFRPREKEMFILEEVFVGFCFTLYCPMNA